MSRKRKPRREQAPPPRTPARREREGSHRRSRSPVVKICRTAESLNDAFEAELYVSELLGLLWQGLADENLIEPGDILEPEATEAFVTECAAVGGRGALVILRGFAALADPGPAGLAGRLAGELEGSVNAPEWAGSIGTARPERAAVITEQPFEDGRTWLVESARSDGTRDTIGIYIDNNLGCSADEILLSPPIDVARKLIDKNAEPGFETDFEEVDLALAAARLRAAMDLAEDTVDLHTEEDEEFAALRALAYSRLDALPAADPDDGRPKVQSSEREALLAEFLASPETETLTGMEDASMLAQAAIDFASDYADGRPLRWSPMLVEIFTGAWLPTKVVADEEFFDAVPVSLEAWVRFTARKRNLATEDTAQLLDAVESSTSDLLAQEDESPGERSVGAELVEAMREAGVDPTDQKALETFIAGWNARSTLD